MQELKGVALGQRKIYKHLIYLAAPAIVAQLVSAQYYAAIVNSYVRHYPGSTTYYKLQLWGGESEKSTIQQYGLI